MSREPCDRRQAWVTARSSLASAASTSAVRCVATTHHASFRRQLAERVAELGLAGGIERGARLVEEEQSPVAGQQAVDRSRCRDALRLSAREARSARAEESVGVELDAREPERTPEQLGRGGLVAEPHVVARSSRRPASASARPTRSPSDRPARAGRPSRRMSPSAPAKPRIAANRVDLPVPLSPVTATTCPARGRESHPVDDDALAATHSQVDEFEARRVRSARCSPGGARTRFRRRFRRAQQVECVARRRHPGSRCVERRTDVAEREEDLGCEHEHEEPGGQGHVAGDEPQADRDGHERDREARRELERESREERDAQHLHRARPILVGHGPDPGRLALGAAEDGEGRESTDHLEEAARKRREALPLASLHGGGGHADERHEHGDERQHDHEHEPRERVGDPRGDDQDRRRDDAEHELREIPPEVLVERVEPRSEQGRDASGREPRNAGRAGLERGEQVGSQLPLHAHRASRAHEIPEPGGDGPSGCRDEEPDEQRPGLWHPHAVDEARDERGERPCEADRGGGLHERERTTREEEPACGAGSADEPRVEGLHVQCAADSMDARVTRLRKIQYVQPW